MTYGTRFSWAATSSPSGCLQQVHVSELHHVGGVATMLGAVTRLYHLHRGKPQIRRVLNACLVVGTRTQHQTTSRWPLCHHSERRRRAGLSAFTTTGIDLAGPFLIKIGRANAKRWICLFTCSTYRCTHIETVSSLTTDAFPDGLFQVPLAPPEADNGHHRQRDEFRRSRSTNHGRHRWADRSRPEEVSKISWRFNPPHSPHMGGFWERLVGLAKTAFYTMLAARPHKLTEDEFHTAFVIVEGLLNSRPVAVQNDDIDLAITPAHFMCADAISDIAVGGTTWPTNKSYAKLQECMDEYWARFHSEVLPALHRQSKWFRQRDQLVVGQIVLLLENKERGRWHLGKIVALPPSFDGTVREVEVFIAGKTKRRPIHLLAPLSL